MSTLWVPLGSIGLTIFGLDLALASMALPQVTRELPVTALLGQSAVWRVLADLLLLGMFGGFFIVPLYALVQLRSTTEKRARIIAANNIINAFFMVVGALAAAAMFAGGLSIPMLFAVAAICNAAVAVFIYGLVPEFLLRFLAWVLIHLFYRLKKRGVEHIPHEGAALIVCNHVSFVDPVILMAVSPRPIRFVMDHHIFRTPLISFIFRHTRAIPIASAREDAAMMERAFADVSLALREGELVGIFPEGRITDTGELYPFRPGVTLIAHMAQVPIQTVVIETPSPYLGKDWPIWRAPQFPVVFSARLGQRFILDSYLFVKLIEPNVGQGPGGEMDQRWYPRGLDLMSVLGSERAFEIEDEAVLPDFLLGQAFKMMVEVGSLDALDVLSSASAVIAEGEVLQLSVAKKMETTEDDYLSVIRAKTAALFAAAGGGSSHDRESGFVTPQAARSKNSWARSEVVISGGAKGARPAKVWGLKRR